MKIYKRKLTEMKLVPSLSLQEFAYIDDDWLFLNCEVSVVYWGFMVFMAVYVISSPFKYLK